jgi:hypothetical protein
MFGRNKLTGGERSEVRLSRVECEREMSLLMKCNENRIKSRDDNVINIFSVSVISFLFYDHPFKMKKKWNENRVKKSFSFTH